MSNPRIEDPAAIPGEALVRRSALIASKTNEGRLTRLVQTYFGDVWRALRRLGVADASCDDASQEVFIVVSRKLESIDPSGERQYLYGVAIRVAANFRRSHAARREQVDETALLAEPSAVPNSEALLDEKRARQLLDQVLDAMSQDLRTAFVLFEVEGFSLQELTRMLNIPLGTVSSRLRRAREAFHQAALRLRRTQIAIPERGDHG